MSDVATYFPDLTGATFTRASVKTATTVSKELVSFLSGVPAVTDAGILIESAATNPLTRSYNFGHADWSKIASTVVTTVLPSTKTFAGYDKIAEAVDNSEHYVEQSFTPASTTTYTFQVKATKHERHWLGLQLNFGGIAGVYVMFDLINGVLGAVGGGVGAIEDLGDGEYLCSITGTTVSTAPGSCRIFVSNQDGVAAYVGTLGAGLDVADAQLEIRAYPSSYIPTVATGVTRAADTAQIDLTLAAEGALYAEFEGTRTALSGLFASSSDLVLYTGLGVGAASQLGVGVPIVTANVTTPGVVAKAALSWNSLGRTLCLNGGAVVSGATCAGAGGPFNLGQPLEANLRKILIFESAKTDAELQALTA